MLRVLLRDEAGYRPSSHPTRAVFASRIATIHHGGPAMKLYHVYSYGHCMGDVWADSTTEAVRLARRQWPFADIDSASLAIP
jgi:hypothetical protein